MSAADLAVFAAAPAGVAAALHEARIREIAARVTMARDLGVRMGVLLLADPVVRILCG
jgi:hypothetical protein